VYQIVVASLALVLEMVEGPSLADWIDRGPIPTDEALPIARQIAQALEAATLVVPEAGPAVDIKPVPLFA
jgi:serine/threonine protein kinase